MAATNVQAFSGDVEITSNLEVGTANLFVDTVSGRVGIGTTAADCNLEIYGSTSSIKVTRAANSVNFGTTLDFALLNSANEKFTYGRITGAIADNTDGSEDGILSFQVGTNGNLRSNYEEEKMRITSDGNVGIGKANPGSKLDVEGVIVAKDTAETSTLLIMAGGQGGGSNSNEYNPGHSHLGAVQIVSEQTVSDEFSSMCVINKDRDNNTTKNASIGFFTTDTSGTGKYVGKIGFWPEDGNSVQGQFRIYTGGGNAGYNFPVKRMVVRADGNVDITTAGAILSVTGEVRGNKDTDTTSYFGRAAIGYCGLGDLMSIAHHDINDGSRYALLQSSTGITYLNCAAGQQINFRESNANKMVLNNGKLGIAYNAAAYPLSINGGLYARKWNAWNDNTANSNYTFPESGIYFVGFMYANGDDGNISEYYTIGVSKSGANAGVTRHKDSGYLNYAVQSYDTVRFWSGAPSNALPSGYNSSNFYLVIYAAGYQ